MVRKTKTELKLEDMLTVEALRYYVPKFHEADQAYERLIELLPDSPGLRVQTETALAYREIVVDKLMDLAKLLIIKELNNIISKSHLRGSEESIYNQLFYAGRAGAIKGLRHFDVDKLEASATNYLLQWFTAYAKKELLAIEAAPFGIPPSRFNTYKKISAVRKKLGAELGRYAENDEVLKFLHSGAADVKSMNGRKGANNKRYSSNQKITLEFVEEQEFFERYLIVQNLIDPLDKQMSELVFGETSSKLFSETLFGVFLKNHRPNAKALVVLKSELQADLSPSELELLRSLSNPIIRKITNQWKALIQDKTGPFYEFLRSTENSGFDEFDTRWTMRSIENSVAIINKEQWESLFEEGK